MIKKLSLLLAGVLMSCILTGCKNDNLVSATSIKSGVTYDYILIAMDDTGVLYYRSTYNLTPYYNENGHLCRWVDGKIVEIGGDDNER